MYDANRNKEKVQKIANVIIAYGYYQREIKQKMNKKLAFLILFSNHQIAKRKYKKRRKMLNTILFRLIQQQEILGNTLLCGLVPTARRFWMINHRQDWFERLWANCFDQYLCEIWRREFRFSVETFFRKAIPLKKRVAVALWKLATGNSHRSVTSVAKIVFEFCESIFQ